MGTEVRARERLIGPEEIVDLAAARSPVVMMNEAHSGFVRLPRTRKLGAALLPRFDGHGFRLLALEALDEEDAHAWSRSRQIPASGVSGLGYVSQPEMRELLQAALDLGWDLTGYDVRRKQYLERAAWLQDVSGPRSVIGSFAYTQWRELAQARNLLEVWESRQRPKMLVWCGNGHLCEGYVSVTPGSFGPGDRGGSLRTMGGIFAHLSGVDPFTIDQTRTAEWPVFGMSAQSKRQLEEYREELEALGGHGGFLSSSKKSWVDAVILSVDNHME